MAEGIGDNPHAEADGEQPESRNLQAYGRQEKCYACHRAGVTGKYLRGR
jgi:hypothetical protein